MRAGYINGLFENSVKCGTERGKSFFVNFQFLPILSIHKTTETLVYNLTPLL